MPGRKISSLILAWFDQHGRKGLPWQIKRTPYRVWISEIMLQQTQVSTVVPYYLRFMKTFPNVEALAKASSDAVMHLWTGLGYYSRARNLHKAAQYIVQTMEGKWPDTLEGWTALPGVGRSTAGAILAIAFGQKTPILDGNVKRVLTRLEAITDWPGNKETEACLWTMAENLTPAKRTADYTQAIMDLGATVCVRGKPRCEQCPLKARCLAYKQEITHTLPRPKPKRRPLPHRTASLLIVRHANHILLQKRPPSGIWSSLWSLPQLTGVATAASIRTYCRDTLRILPKAGQTLLPPFRHTFTHYHLDIHPILLQCNPRSRKLDSDSEIWYNLQQPQAIGLPAPVKKLLENLPWSE